MNTVQLIGRLTRDPELRYTPKGTATCTIRLAVPRRKRNGEDPVPVYIDVVTFGPQAEAIAEYMGQGRRVGVTGRLEYREWTDQQSGRHSKHEVIAYQVDFLDKPKDAPGDPAPRSWPRASSRPSAQPPWAVTEAGAAERGPAPIRAHFAPYVHCRDGPGL